MHIVIDGYNLIRQSSRFKEMDRQDLEIGRNALVDVLAEYKRIKAHPITVVFDGSDAPAGMPRRDRQKGIELRYSGPGELADAVIKRMAGREGNRLMVVSSDREITEYAARKGAAVIGAAEFEERLTMTRMMALKGMEENDSSGGWQPTTKKLGPSRRLPKRQRQMKRKISKL